MMEDFIVPCLAAVVLPGWLLIMDNAPSHEAKKALEWYHSIYARGRLGAVQLSRHKTQTGHCEGHARTTKTHTLHHCAGTGRVIVQAACSTDLNPLDTRAWNVVKREMVAVRGRVTLKAEAAWAWAAARSCQQPGRLHDWDERLPLCIVANGGAFEHIYFIRLARFVNAIDTNALS